MSELPELEQPETDVVAPEQPARADVVPVEGWIAATGRIGDILPHPHDAEVPEGWVKVDGQRLRLAEYPEFAEAMGAQGMKSLELPQMNHTEQFIYLIKVKNVPLPEVPE